MNNLCSCVRAPHRPRQFVTNYHPTTAVYRRIKSIRKYTFEEVLLLLPFNFWFFCDHLFIVSYFTFCTYSLLISVPSESTGFVCSSAQEPTRSGTTRYCCCAGIHLPAIDYSSSSALPLQRGSSAASVIILLSFILVILMTKGKIKTIALNPKTAGF